MAGMGPPPKPAGTRARRNTSPAMTTLPTRSRRKKAPAWPLKPDVTMAVRKRTADNDVERLRDELNDCDDGRRIGRLERNLDRAVLEADILEAEIVQIAEQEAEVWKELWTMPQAGMWEKLAWNREVAQYVRLTVRAQMGSLESAKEARQWSDRLGLNPLAMLRLRWESERTDDAETRGQQRRKRAETPVADPGVDPRSVIRAVK